MNPTTEENTRLIAYCGLYCANCSRYHKGKCPGCAKNEKAGWCKIRSCCIEKEIASCASCEEFDNPKACSKYNNFPGRVIEFFTATNRSLCIEYLKAHSPEEFSLYMAETGKMSMPKKKK